MKNDQEIIEKIEKLRKNYKLELEDSEKETTIFLEEINDLIGKIFKDPSMSVYTAFDKENLEKWKKSRIARFIRYLKNINLKNIFYLLLLMTITGFLVSEALEFYSIENKITFKTYVKAILTELCFIFLSGYRSKNKTEMGIASFLRICMFSLMLFVITSKTFIDSSKTTNNTDIIQQQVIMLEKQIKQKEKDMEYYLKKDWPRNYSATRLEKEKLTTKLIQLKEKQAAGAVKEVSDLVRYKAYGKAFFRVLLLFISVMITRRIFVF